MDKGKRLAFYVLLVIICLPLAFADEILINSRDWKDVYSGMQYSFLTGYSPKFLVSEAHSTIITNEIQKSSNILVFSSQKTPWVRGYGSMLRDAGYNATETEFRTLSIELARKLTDINDFIIVDDSYGYNAVAVAPYAIVSKSYVLFADRTNINEAANFLASRNVRSVIIYGAVDREVLDRLRTYNPEIINEDGDRFANDVEIVKKYKAIKDAKQVIFTNGEFIEGEIMSGSEPVMFIGIQNVPDKIREYLLSSNIETGVVIGNDLVGTATMIRRELGISTFVKFARTARQPAGMISQVEGLDLFYLPKYDLNIAIESIRYNSATGQLEVTIRNNAEIATYFRGTYTISINGQTQTIGDTESVFIDSNNAKTVVYDIEPIVGEGDITATAFVLFGESRNSLERTLQATVNVERVEVLDDSAIEVVKLLYNKAQHKIYVTIKNTGAKGVYVNAELLDMNILGIYQNIGSDKTIFIAAGGTGTAVIDIELSDEDILSNPTVKVRTYYGGQENILSKSKDWSMELKVQSIDWALYIPIAIIIILLFLIILARRRKKKDKR